MAFYVFLKPLCSFLVVYTRVATDIKISLIKNIIINFIWSNIMYKGEAWVYFDDWAYVRVLNVFDLNVLLI